MLDTWVIVAVLAGLALIANIAVCLYTLHLAKKAAHRQFLEGYITASIEYVEPTTEKETPKSECQD